MILKPQISSDVQYLANTVQKSDKLAWVEGLDKYLDLII